MRKEGSGPMTSPLATKILKDLAKQENEREFDCDDLNGKLVDFHCFEVTDIVELASDMAWQIVQGKVPYDCGFTFLPADRTWIEWKNEEGTREAFFLERKSSVEGRGSQHATIVEVIEDGQFGEVPDWVSRTLAGIGAKNDGIVDELFTPEMAKRFGDSIIWKKMTHASALGVVLPLLDPARHVIQHPHLLDEGRQHTLAMIAVILSLINTPKTIGRRQHMPHRGLQKNLLRSRSPIGKFPLHAWTEILLHVTAPKDLSDEGSVEAHLTGAKALHFCRAHLRVRFGRVEVVKGHWRGDASLGIKRSRYKVAGGPNLSVQPTRDFGGAA